ncbi:MAG: hypothetical protein ACON5H_03755 [Akkermansiaceae bacterium]
MSRKKLNRDREAGLHFHWHLPHGSVGRLLIAVPIALLFWGAVLAYVEIEKVDPAPLPQRAAELEIINLDSPENARLSMIVNRESLFANRWDVRDENKLELLVRDTLRNLSRRDYQVKLREIDSRPGITPTRGLPGFRPDKLPLPAPLEIKPRERPAPEWWIRVTKTSGDDKWDGLSFRWQGDDLALSAGETWTYQIGLDWRGRVVSTLPLKGLRESASREIHNTLRLSTFPRIAEDAPIRWWLLEARAIDRRMNQSASQ